MTGHKLGLFVALAEGPAAPDELAARTGTDARYVDGVAARPGSGRLRHPGGRRGRVLADRGAGVPAHRPRRTGVPAGCVRARPRRAEGRAAHHRGVPHRRRASAGTSTTTTCSSGASSSSGPGTPRTWCPSGSRRSTASRPSCERGARSPTSAAGSARPASCSRTSTRSPGRRVRLPRGLDRAARKRAAEAGVSERATFEVASAQTFSGHGYDLVTTFDCLHDMGDPLSAARHIRASPSTGRHLADRGAVRRRQGGREHQPGRPDLLQLLDVPRERQKKDLKLYSFTHQQS